MARIPASLDNIAFAALILIAFGAIAPRAGHSLLSHSVPVLEEGPRRPVHALKVSAGKTPYESEPAARERTPTRDPDSSGFCAS
jgi:hypothetical protein